MKKLPTTSYAVLGLLSLSEMSGYELARLAGMSIAHFWPISKSQVYAELSRLEELGFVSGTDIKQERVPDKRTFKLTDEGAAALDLWLADPSYDQERFRHGFLVKFFFAARMPKDRLLELVTRYRDASREALASFIPMTEQIPEKLTYPRLSAEFGIEHLKANVRWADRVIASLSEPRSTNSKPRAKRAGASTKGATR